MPSAGAAARRPGVRVRVGVCGEGKGKGEGEGEVGGEGVGAGEDGGKAEGGQGVDLVAVDGAVERAIAADAEVGGAEALLHYQRLGQAAVDEAEGARAMQPELTAH